jgi:hypothetical protein
VTPLTGPEQFAAAVAANADRWVPACGGTETPFRTRSGRVLLYCWNPRRGHAYLDVATDIVLTAEESDAYLCR